MLSEKLDKSELRSQKVIDHSMGALCWDDTSSSVSLNEPHTVNAWLVGLQAWTQWCRKSLGLSNWRAKGLFARKVHVAIFMARTTIWLYFKLLVSHTRKPHPNNDRGTMIRAALVLQAQLSNRSSFMLKHGMHPCLFGHGVKTKKCFLATENYSQDCSQI